MKLEELLKVLYKQKICVYEEAPDGTFLNLYKGDAGRTPEALKGRSVLSIGTLRGALDICIK